MRISHRVWHVFMRNFTVFKKTWLANVMFNFIEPLLYLGAMGFGLGVFVEDIDGLPYINWMAPGLIATSAMWAAALECTYDSYMRMNYQKTYHAIIATPVNLEEVVVGEILFGTFKSLLYGIIIIIVISALGLVPSPWVLLVLPVLALEGLAVTELSITWTGLVPGVDAFGFFFTLVITPMFLFSGVFFPLDGLPVLVQVIAWFMPLYHVVELTRSLTLGTVGPSLLYDVLWLVVFITVLFKLPLYLMRRRLID
ncbi:MAG: ABC transporter permease [Firmicutes bacterium]|nr:ABC transporter permease [Bacillota bacterium]